MFKWLSQPLGKGKQKRKQVQQKESSKLGGQGETLQQGSSDSLRALLERAITDAERIVSSVKLKAQTEAEAEATQARTAAEMYAEAKASEKPAR